MVIFALTEKAAAAQAIAAAYGLDRGDGCFTGRIHGKQVLLTWASGTLYELKEPQEIIDGASWSDPRTLVGWQRPSIKQFMAEPTDSHAKKTLANIKKHWRSVQGQLDYPLIATDADAAGEAIGRDVFWMLGYTGKVRRLFLSHGLEPAAIKRSFKEIKGGDATINLWFAEQARRLCDWNYQLVTRAYTSLAPSGDLGEALAKGKGKEGVVSVGRVQTPTLRIVVERDREIENFKPVDHYRPQVTIAGRVFTYKPSKNLEVGKHRGVQWDERAKTPTPLFVDQEIVKGWARSIQEVGEAKVRNQIKDSTKHPPKCHSLTSLQRHMAKEHKITAAKTLKLAQELYLAKLISYPRTEHEELPASELADAPKLLEGLKPVVGDKIIDQAKDHIEFADGMPPTYSKAGHEHHGLRPTTKVPDDGELKGDQLLLYRAVVDRYVEAHLPPCRIQVHSHVAIVGVITPVAEPYSFFGNTETYVLDPGWRAAFQGEEVTEPAPVLEGQMPLQRVQVKAKKTKAPPQFTEATLLGAMLNAGRYAEDDEDAEQLKAIEGIGTPATRDTVIEKLLTRKYLRRQKGKIVSEQRGRDLIDVLPDDLTSVTKTAKWEQRKREIQEAPDKTVGQRFRNDFLKMESHRAEQEIVKVIERLEKRGVDLDASPAEGAPSEKQIDAARKLAAAMEIDIPEKALTSWKACSEFIDSLRKQVPPSDKALRFAESLAKDKGIDLPPEAANTAAGCSDFINEHRSGKGQPRRAS